VNWNGEVIACQVLKQKEGLSRRSKDLVLRATFEVRQTEKNEVRLTAKKNRLTVCKTLMKKKVEGMRAASADWYGGL